MSESSAFRIRPATSGDAASIAEIYAPYVLETVISFEATPPDSEEMGRRIAAITAAYPWIVAEQGGRIAGYAYAGRHNARAAYDWSADVSVYLHADFHRRGLGRRLYERLFRVLQAQRCHALFSMITLPNAASIALHRSLGFYDIGTFRDAGFKFGQWRDVFIMGAKIDERATPLAPFTPIRELREYQDLLQAAN